MKQSIDQNNGVLESYRLFEPSISWPVDTQNNQLS